MSIRRVSAVAAVAGSALAVVSPTTIGPTTAVPSTCIQNVPGLRASYAAQVTAGTKQVVVAKAKSKQSSANTIRFWQRADGCWTLTRKIAGRNGFAGWSKRAVDGSGLSPIGAYTLTDAGGRLANPGTKLPYHFGPQSYSAFGYKMNNQRVQIFDYVVAINFNRFIGKPPRDEGRPSRAIQNGGIWFHVNGAGPTRGCISIAQADMAWVLQWLNPSDNPMIVMGPKKAIRPRK